MPKKRAALAVLLCFLCLPAPLLGQQPTTEEVLALARRTARELGSRDCMVKIARHTRRSDAAQALGDYQAAAEVRPPARWSRQMRVISDYEVGRALVELGDPDGGLPLLKAALQETLELSPGHGDADYWNRDQVWHLAEFAEALACMDPETAVSTLQHAAEYLERIEKDNAKKEALRSYLFALALTEPQRAYQRYRDELAPWHFSERFVRNLIKGDPTVAATHVEDLFGTEKGKLGLSSGPGADRVAAELVVTLFRASPQQALEVAVKVRLGRWAESADSPCKPLAAEIHKSGIEALPRAPEYDGIYVSVAQDLALLDYDAAKSLALSLAKPYDRYRALANMARALAPHDLAQAADAARAAIEILDRESNLQEMPLQAATDVLAEYDEKIVPELLTRLRSDWAVGPPFGKWWQYHRQAAEALFPKLTEAQQLACIPYILSRGETLLTADEKRALAAQALGYADYGKDVPPAFELIRQSLKFDLDLARKQWQALEPLDLESVSVTAIVTHLDVLLQVADAYEQRQRGSSGPEVAAIAQIIAGAREGATWTYRYRALLADIYAWYDGKLCKATVEEVVASLQDAPKSVDRNQVLAAAACALARVDMQATREFMRQHEEVRRNRIRETVSIIARRRPEFACEMALELFAPATANNSFDDVLANLAREGPPEAAIAFADTWMQGTQQRPAAFRAILRTALQAQRADLMARLPQYLDMLDADWDQISAMQQYSVFLVFATDALLDEFLARLQRMDANQTKDAMAGVIAAKAERDWQGSQELLAGLAPESRIQALLLLVDMRDRKQALQNQGDGA